MNIEIDNNYVTSCATKLCNYATDFESEIKNIESIVDKINTAWNGDDSLKYVNTMKDKCIKNLKKLQDILDDYGTYLTKVPGVYSSVDNAYASKNIDV